jgi:hypothetical protein
VSIEKIDAGKEGGRRTFEIERMEGAHLDMLVLRGNLTAEVKGAGGFWRSGRSDGGSRGGREGY